MSSFMSRFVRKNIVVSVFAGLLITVSISILSASLGRVRAEVTALPLVTPTPCPTPDRTLYDFDNDCKADLSVWKQAESSFVVQKSGQNTTETTQIAGHQRDRTVPADYDGDGRTDYAVFNDANLVWNIVKSSNQESVTFTTGMIGDVPVPGDFDGDKKADVAVWRPKTGDWFVLKSTTNNSGWDVVNFGVRGDVPVVGDYDNDGKADRAVWRPSNGTWYLLRSRDGLTGQQWGLNGDVPVPADYDGDGKTDVAVYRPSDGYWYYLPSSGGSYVAHQWGVKTDKPVPADYDGDGKADIAYWRPVNRTWSIVQSSNQQSYNVVIGEADDTPVPTGGKCSVSSRTCWENTYNLNYNSSPTEWQIKQTPQQTGAFSFEINGYASKTSINVDETIDFHVNVRPAGDFKIEIYRMGWYGGAGASLIDTINDLEGEPQTFSEANHVTGLIEYNWTPYTWNPPDGIVSGFYIAKLSTIPPSPENPLDAKHSYIIFVVRDDEQYSDFLFQSAVTTYQAYNFFPERQNTQGNPNGDWTSGKSLYGGNLSWGPLLPGVPPNGSQDRQAREVSFNRPYYPQANIYYTAGQFFEFEYNMVRWMEKEGYDVTYQTDIDTDERPQNLAPGNHNTLLSVGHDEYWSWKMRENVENARNRSDRPLNIGFFGGNISHWQIRFKNSFTSSSPDSAPYRTIVAYKQHYNDEDEQIRVGDPYYKNDEDNDNYLITYYWRHMRDVGITDCMPPLTYNCHCPSNIPDCTKPPEDELVGVMTKIDPVITGDFNFVFKPTPPGTLPSWIKNGIPNDVPHLENLVSYEGDSYLNSYPGRDLEIVGKSPITNCTAPNTPMNCTTYDTNAVFYKLNSNNARVFAIGSVRWAWGLDDFGQVPDAYGYSWKLLQRTNVHAETLTRNVLTCFLYGGATCSN